MFYNTVNSLINQDLYGELGRTTTTWRQAIKQEFGGAFFNEMIGAYMEQYIYGSSRTSTKLSTGLGNVLAVVTDRKIQLGFWEHIMYNVPQVVSVSDYYPFASKMEERSWSATEYKFGFNAQEKDDKISGGGNSLDFGVLYSSS